MLPFTPTTEILTGSLALAPAVLMGMMAGRARLAAAPARLWREFVALASISLLCAACSLAVHVLARAGVPLPPGLATSLAGAWLAVVVLFLGTIIGAFSSRYLEGEPDQDRYVGALCGVLAAVQVLLLADHWVVLIGSWALTGVLLERLLCFYPDRPFALLAAHKKWLADRLADLLLTIAGVSAWWEVGSGSLSALREHLAHAPASLPLQVSALCLVLAVLLRTALLPVHGWLTQVMEAPTPVSALMHAGVVNLGGVVLLRFAPLLEVVDAARWLAVLVGLATAVLAGLVTLTRVSLKVRLAWSTIAQMGFMVLECGLGLYSLAMLHLVGHSLYKAHAFLSSSTAVRQTTLRMMRAAASPTPAGLVAAPLFAAAIVLVATQAAGQAAWPLWWTGVLALAWAPLMWIPARCVSALRDHAARLLAGGAMVVLLTAAAMLVHRLPLGVVDKPDDRAGWAAFVGLTLLHLVVAVLQRWPRPLAAWRRRAYAGFYLDEAYTRAALALWPTRKTPTLQAGHAIGHDGSS